MSVRPRDNGDTCGSINILLRSLATVDAVLLTLCIPVFTFSPYMHHMPSFVHRVVLNMYPLAMICQVSTAAHFDKRI